MPRQSAACARPLTSAFIRDHAIHSPRRVAVENSRDRITYERFHATIQHVWHRLRDQAPLPPGTIVAVCVGDVYLHWIMLLACENLGWATCSMVDSERDSAERLLERAGLLITDRAGRWEGAVREIVVDADWCAAARDGGQADLWEPMPVWPDEAPWRVRRSSGTTGSPRMMMATRACEEHQIASAATLMGITSESRYWPTVSLSVGSVLTQMNLCARLGATVVLIRSAELKTHETIVRRGITHLRLFQPELRRTLANLPEGWVKPSNLTLIMGAAPMGEALWESIRSRLVTRIVYTYNANECGPIARMRPGGLGTVRPGVLLQIVDDDDQPVPEGTVGNIRVKTPSTVDGYLDDDEATGQMFRGGWFYPNDVGLLRGPDQLTLVDRKDNILNIGGRKFSPAPFEEAARAIPFVADCHVTSLVGRQGSSRVVVLVVCRQPTERSVVEAEFRRIRPRHFGLIDVQLVDQIPRTANGKVRRDGVKELHDERVCIRVG